MRSNQSSSLEVTSQKDLVLHSTVIISLWGPGRVTSPLAQCRGHHWPYHCSSHISQLLNNGIDRGHRDHQSHNVEWSSLISQWRSLNTGQWIEWQSVISSTAFPSLNGRSATDTTPNRQAEVRGRPPIKYLQRSGQDRGLPPPEKSVTRPEVNWDTSTEYHH